jgi:site-specific DNA-cytosine methylase
MTDLIKHPMKVLSLFDGMSCGQIALNRIGMTPDAYYAAEIDKYAVQVTQANYPATIQLGDVNKWRKWDIDWSSIDLLIGGSPCQGFSFLGKQLAFDDPRSKLFFVYVDILNYIKSVNPNIKFMLENVKMKSEYLNIISEHLGTQPVFINSALLSAQNRQRYYWANWEVNQPEDKGIMLSDIIEDGYVEKNKSWAMLESWNRFPVKTESAIGRYKRSMMPIVFTTPDCDFYKGWRELNRTECELLQTVPIGYTSVITEKKAKGVMGNAWTVDVIAHILKEGLL